MYTPLYIDVHGDEHEHVSARESSAAWIVCKSSWDLVLVAWATVCESTCVVVHMCVC
jgi:hypothetical protein